MKKAIIFSDELLQHQYVHIFVNRCHGQVQVLKLLILAESSEEQFDLTGEHFIPTYVQYFQK